MRVPKFTSKTIAAYSAAGLAVCVVVAVAGWLLMTSSFAVCKLWLPLASKFSGMKISASEAGLSPLRGHVEAKNLHVSKDGLSVDVDSLSVDAATFKALFGSYEVRSLNVSGAHVVVSPSLASSSPKESAAPASSKDAVQAAKPSKPLRLKTGALKIEDSSFDMFFASKDGKSRPFVSFSKIFASCDGMAPGSESHLAVSCTATGEDFKELSVKSANFSLQALYQPDADFAPEKLALRCSFALASACLDGADLSGSALDFNCALKNSSSRIAIDSLELVESFKGRRLSSFALAGSVGKSPLDLDLALKARAVNSPLLDYLIDFAVDCDLSKAELECASVIKYSAASAKASCSGAMTLRNAQLLPHSKGLATDLGPLDVEFKHEASADLQSSTADVKTMSLGVSSSGRRLLDVLSTRPFSVCWAKGQQLWPKGATPELALKIDKLPLSVANAFTGGAISFTGGALDLDGLLRAASASSGKQASLKISLGVKGLSMAGREGKQLVLPSDLSGELAADLLSDSSVSLEKADFALLNDGVKVATLSSKGSFVPAGGNGKLRSSLKVLNYRAIDLVGMPEESAAKLKGGLRSLQPFELAFENEVSCVLSKSEATASVVDLSFTSKKYGRVSCALTEPLKLGWAKGFHASSAKFALQSSDLDLALVNNFQDKGGKKLRGRCDSLVNGVFDLEKALVSLKGGVNLDAIPLELPGSESVKWSVSADFEAAMSDWDRLNLSSLKIKTLEPDGETVGLEAAMAGVYSLKSSSGSFETRSCHADGAALDKLCLLSSSPANVRKFFAALSPMDFNLKASTSFDLASSKASLSSFDAGIMGKGGQMISLGVEKPFDVCWAKDAKSLQDGSAKFRIVMRKASLPALGSFVPPSAAKFDAGSLNVDMAVVVEGLWREIQADGEMSTENLDMSVGGSCYKGFDPYLKGSVSLSNFAKKLDIQSMNFGARVDKVERFASLAKGSLDFSAGSPDGKIGLQISKLDEKFLSKLPFGFASGVRELDLTGRLLWSPSAKPDVSSNMACEIKLAKFSSDKIQESGKPVDFSGALVSNVDYSKTLLAFKQCNVNVAGGGKLLADLSISGQLRNNPSSGPSSLSISSNALNLKTIQTLLAKTEAQKIADAQPQGWSGSGKTQKQQAAVQPQPAQQQADATPVEPGPVDFHGYSGSVSFDLKNVTYGPTVNSSLVGRVVLSQPGMISTDGLLLTVNGSPLNLTGGIDLSKADGYEYSFLLVCQYLNLAPIAKAFENDTKGEIKSFQFKISGKGITQPNLAKSLNSTFKTQLAGLDIPYQGEGLYIFRLIFYLPIEILGNIDQIVGGSNQFDLSSVKQSMNSIKSKSKNIKFGSGEIDIVAASGVVTINKLNFKDGDPVTTLLLSGTEKIADGSLNINTRCSTKSNNVSIITPIRIGGTVKSPSPNYPMILPDMLQANAANILNPENLTDGTASSLFNTVLDIGKKIESLKK